MGVLPVSMAVHHMYNSLGGQTRAFLGNGVTDSCKPSCRYWESNPGPLKEQRVLLMTELFLQLPRPS